MGARGFVFSLDAFVAFVLIMITINLLIFTIGTPKPYYTELEAAHILAHDTLQVLATSGDTPAQTYLERILKDEGSTDIPYIMRRVAGGNESCRPIIPKGYGYRLEFLNLNGSSQTGASENWTLIYDASNDASSDRFDKNYTKLQASATTFLSVYLDHPPWPGESPFCYKSCSGYESTDNDGHVNRAVPCNATPCDKMNSNFLPSNNTVRIVRLVVYT